MPSDFAAAVEMVKELLVLCKQADDPNVKESARIDAGKKARRLASKLAIAVADSARPRRVFFFGCWREAGHFLFHPNGRYAHGQELGTPWRSLDATLCPGAAAAKQRREHSVPRSQQVEGSCLLHQKGGWTALAFWDRSVDHRFGSNAAFIAEGELDFGQMVDVAKTYFADVFNRFGFELVLAGNAQ